MTKDQVLAALDKPRTIDMLVPLLRPGGVVALQTLLMQMRNDGLVKFDIRTGLWSRA